MASFSIYNDDTYDNMYVNAINTHFVNSTGVNLIGNINVNGNLTSNIIGGTTTTLTNMTSTGNFLAESTQGSTTPSALQGLTVAGNSTFVTAGGGQLGFFGVGPVNQQANPGAIAPLPADVGTPLGDRTNALITALQAYGLLG